MRLTALTLLCSCLIAAPAYADSCTSASNLAANCGFETGDFSGWTLSGYDSAPGYNGIDYGVDTFDAHSGLYGAYLGGFGGVLDLSQSIATTPGTDYSITFWLAQSAAPVSPYLNSVSAEFGTATLISLTQVPDMAYAEYSFNVPASSSSTALVFGFRDDIGFFSLDSVTVTAAPVPEPAFSWVLIPLLLAALAIRVLPKLV